MHKDLYLDRIMGRINGRWTYIWTEYRAHVGPAECANAWVGTVCMYFKCIQSKISRSALPHFDLKVYERAVANLPPANEKRYWQR